MITPDDVQFHLPSGADHTWAETNFFAFYVPERNLCGSVYVVTRKALGSTLADISLFDRISVDRKDCLLVDSQQHLPAPDRLSDYTLPNGLTVRAVRPPRDYEITYDGPGETRFDLRFEALMDPFDLHADEATNGGDASSIAAYTGHFDMTGRIRGTIVVGGEPIEVDCVDTMDHSWGPRPEHGHPDIVWMHAHFGEERAFHAILVQHPERDEQERYEFIRGYALVEGEVVPMQDVQLRANRAAGMGTGMEVLATGTNGLQLHLRGAAVAATNVGWYSCMEINYALHRWMDERGRVGYGCVQESVMYDRRTARNRLECTGTVAVAR